LGPTVFLTPFRPYGLFSRKINGSYTRIFVHFDADPFPTAITFTAQAFSLLTYQAHLSSRQ
jgi:hypothetical protein